MKKRILSLLLVVIMVFALPLTAYAANVGEKVTISFSANHTGIKAFEAELAYNHEALKLVSVTGTGMMVDYYGDHVGGISTSAFTNTTLFTATFEVLPGAKACASYPVTAAGYVADADYVETSMTFAGGSVAASGDHSWGAWTGSAATCGAAANRTRTCSACGATETDSTPATGNHTYGAWTNASATQHKHVCSGCNAEELQNHTWNAGVITTQPTCGVAGVKTFTCTGCGATKTESVGATNAHNYTTYVKVDGEYHKGVCSCGAESANEAHTWNAGTVTTQPTCNEPGVKTYTCTATGCGATKTEEVRATGNHTYGDWEPVDGEDKHEGTCSCGATTKENHIWEWVTDKAATSTTTGIKHEECSECGAKRNENTEIPKVDAGLDDVPKTGDITSDLVMITMAVVVMFCAAGAYIFKRKTR